MAGKATASVVVLAVVLAALGAAPARGAGYPWATRIGAAERFADQRQGTVSFAVVDERGELRGDHVHRVHNSASVVKVMFLVAYLREGGVRRDALTGSEKHLLGAMIKRSNNDAANEIYERLGNGPLYELAADAGMEHFTTGPLWGLSEITPRDQARFMYSLGRFVPKRHRGYALHLLTRIVNRQRWGIPPVAPGGWRLSFKGGWSGRPHWRVNQVMLLRRPPRRFSVAILTRDQPSKVYGERTIEGVARRLLEGYNRLTR